MMMPAPMVFRHVCLTDDYCDDERHNNRSDAYRNEWINAFNQ